MRKNKGIRKDIKHLYATFEVRGVNLDMFIERLKNRGIGLFDVKKLAFNRLQVTVNFKDIQNFFAISKELCYNVKKKKIKGLGYPIYALFNSFGLALGAAIFIISLILLNDVIFSFSFSGSGSLYKNQVIRYLEEQGIKKFTRFSAVNLDRLEDGILATNPNVSFASCKKQGNKLIIELVLSDKDNHVLSGDKYQLLAEADGEVESIKVYRGTACVKKGDLVKRGDLLVDGIATIKEQTIKINVIASVSLTCSAEYVYRSFLEGEEAKAIVFAQEALDGREVLSCSVQTTQVGDEYVYVVNSKYRRITTVG